MTTAECLIPTLRFSEFAELWCEKKLGGVSTLVTSGSRDWSQYYSNSGDKFIRMTNLSRTGIDLLLKDMRYVKLPENSKDGLRTSLQQDDILISITAELGKIGWIPPNFGTAYINQHTALVRTNNKECSKFVAYLISSAKMNKKLNRLNDSGAKSGLNLSTIRSLDFLSPSKKEQQKISKFLTSVDTKIQQLKRKHTLMQQYKKGVMQQLFSQQARFKDDDGRNYPDWGKCKLQDIAKGGLSNGVFNDPKKVGKGYRLINVKDMYSGEVINNSSLSLLDLSHDEFIKNKAEYGDVFFTRSSLVASGIAYSSVNLSNDKDITYDGHLVRLRPNQEILDSRFLSYLLRTPSSRQQLVSRGKTTTMTTIGQGDIASILITFPCLAEQQKVAKFLDSINEKIQKIATQKIQVETFKKGLLQQMFV